MSVTDDYAMITAALGEKGDQRAIAEEGVALTAMLLRKNEAYGSSAFDPLRVFAKGMTPLDMIHVRMDDKLSRIYRGMAVGEDPAWDFAGYCVLERIARKREAQA